MKCLIRVFLIVYFGLVMNPRSAKTVHYKNDLRHLTAVIGGALVIFGAVLVAIVAYAGWSANRTAIVRERQLVENALDQSVSSVLDQQKAIAWWDDAVANAQRRNNHQPLNALLLHGGNDVLRAI